jgi:hypothetical protein
MENNQTVTGGGFASMDEIRAANRAIGHHWFSGETLRFFDGRVSDTLHAGRMFGHSIRFDENTPRQYRVGIARDTGEIEQIDHDFDRPALRDAFLHRRDHKIEVRFDPYNAELVEGEADPEHYHWRVYMDGLPVGVRDTLGGTRAWAETLGAG